jgi:Ran-binding protein 9/10
MVANQDQEAETASPATTAMDLMQLASWWLSPAEWNVAAEELEAESAPSELNSVNISGLFAVVSADKMSARYLETALHSHNVPCLLPP